MVFDGELEVDLEAVKGNWEIFRKVKRWVGQVRERRITKGEKEMREGIKGMRMLAVQEMVRGIVQFGETFEIKEMMEVFHEVSEGFLGDIGEYLKNVREEVLKVLGSIIHTYSIWSQKLLKIINESVKSYTKITSISPPNLKIPASLSLSQKLSLLSTYMYTLSLLHSSKPTQFSLLPLLTSLPPFLNLNHAITLLHSSLSIPSLPPSPSASDLLAYTTCSLMRIESYNKHFEDLSPYFLEVKVKHYLEGRVRVGELAGFLIRETLEEGVGERVKARLQEGRVVMQGFEKDLREANAFREFVVRVRDRIKEGGVEGYLLEKRILEVIERKIVFLR